MNSTPSEESRSLSPTPPAYSPLTPSSPQDKQSPPPPPPSPITDSHPYPYQSRSPSPTPAVYFPVTPQSPVTDENQILYEPLSYPYGESEEQADTQGGMGNEETREQDEETGGIPWGLVEEEDPYSFLSQRELEDEVDAFYGIDEGWDHK